MVKEIVRDHKERLGIEYETPNDMFKEIFTYGNQDAAKNSYMKYVETSLLCTITTDRINEALVSAQAE
jgi:hypothetical protein